MKTKITYKEFKETIAKANKLISEITFDKLADTMLKDHNLDSMILAKKGVGIGNEYLTLRVFADGHLAFAFETEKKFPDDFSFESDNLIYFVSLVNDTTDTVKLLVDEYLNDNTVKYVISWTLNKIYNTSDTHSYLNGITQFDDLVSALKRTKLISLTKIKNSDNYKLKIKPTSTEYSLKYFVNRKDYDGFYLNLIMNGNL